VTDPFARATLGDAAAAARAEWRADEEAWTRAAAEQWRHNRTMRDVLRDSMHRGDRLELVLPSITFAGAVAAVGDDVVVLDAIDGLIDVNVAAQMPFLVRVLERAHTGGTRGMPVTTLRARALELETDGSEVRVGCSTLPSVLEGRVQVGRDHLGVVDRDGGEIVVPFGVVAWIGARSATVDEIVDQRGLTDAR
jgi:hypothetical protein